MGCTSSKEIVQGDIEDIKKIKNEIKTNKIKNEEGTKKEEKEQIEITKNEEPEKKEAKKKK